MFRGREDVDSAKGTQISVDMRCSARCINAKLCEKGFLSGGATTLSNAKKNSMHCNNTLKKIKCESMNCTMNNATTITGTK